MGGITNSLLSFLSMNTCTYITYLCYTQASCNLTYNGRASPGLYAVALQVEDFISASSTEAMSSVPVQFLVKIVRVSAPPSVTPPTFVRQTTPSDGDCFNIAIGSTYEQRLTARSGDSSAR